MIAVGEHLVLSRQEGAAAFDQVDAGQCVVRRDLLGPQMLLHGERIIGSAFDRGIIGHDHALAGRYPPDPGNEPRARQFLAIHTLSGQCRQLQERRPRIQQCGDALARQQLAALDVLIARGRAAAGGIAAQRAAQILDQPLHGGAVVGEVLRAGVELRGYFGHGFVALSVAELSDSPIIQRSWSDDNGGRQKWPIPHIENSPSAWAR